MKYKVESKIEYLLTKLLIHKSIGSKVLFNHSVMNELSTQYTYDCTYTLEENKESLFRSLGFAKTSDTVKSEYQKRNLIKFMYQNNIDEGDYNELVKVIENLKSFVDGELSILSKSRERKTIKERMTTYGEVAKLSALQKLKYNRYKLALKQHKLTRRNSIINSDMDYKLVIALDSSKSMTKPENLIYVKAVEYVLKSFKDKVDIYNYCIDVKKRDSMMGPEFHPYKCNHDLVRTIDSKYKKSTLIIITDLEETGTFMKLKNKHKILSNNNDGRNNI